MAEPQSKEQRQIAFYRGLLGAGGIAYLAWWVFVRLTLPPAFNPLSGRLLVVAVFVTGYLASVFGRLTARQLSLWLVGCCWLVTAHYYYLFEHNAGDLNWVTGSYITVAATCGLISGRRALLAYSLFVLVLTIGVVALHPTLPYVVLIPGIATILIFANLALNGRLKLAAELEERNRRINQLFDATFEGVALHEQGIYREANRALATILGYPGDELIGVPVQATIAPEDRAMVADKIQSRSEAPYELRMLRRDGVVVTVEAAGRKVTIDGREMRLVAIRDLADRQRADREHILYEASREALRLRDEFIALAAHELRTPLTSLKLRSSFAKQQLDGKADAQVEAGWVLELVGKVSYQVDRLIRLVEELLDASRVKSGLSLDVGPIDLAALARETLDEMADVLRAAKCELKLQADLGVEVMADRLWIERVITSLVNNAIKFGEGGLVEVVIAQQGGDALLSVRDHGVGIAEHDQQRIFEKFERVVSDRNVTGLGLGLYLSKEIVEAHHGQIEVKSELGKGALFQVRLPTRGASVSRRSE